MIPAVEVARVVTARAIRAEAIVVAPRRGEGSQKNRELGEEPDWALFGRRHLTLAKPWRLHSDWQAERSCFTPER